MVTLIAIGVTGAVDGGRDFSGELCSWLDEVLLAGEALGGGALGALFDGDEVVKLSGPNGGTFDSTELSGTPDMPLWAREAPKVR